MKDISLKKFKIEYKESRNSSINFEILKRILKKLKNFSFLFWYVLPTKNAIQKYSKDNKTCDLSF